MILWIWAGAIFWLIYLYFKKVYSRFDASQINRLPVIPLLGNMWGTISKKEHFADAIQKLYSSFPDDRFVGHYEFLGPVVVLKDLELLKQITVKDFDSFLNHRVRIKVDNDTLFGRSVFGLKDQKWKDMRATLSPAFTSSKIKLMVPFMVEVGDQMIASLNKDLKKSKKGEMEIEMKDLSTRYANDVIATCVFGLKVDSMSDENNEFYRMGKQAATFTFGQLLKILCFSSIPTIMNILKIKIKVEKVTKYFWDLVKGTMDYREKYNIIRHDMIHLLMEAKKGKISQDIKVPEEDAGFATVEESAIGKATTNREWPDNDLIAQAVVFFIAGFDTVATTTSFMLMELAINPEVQNKLAEEIRETHLKNGGFNYNSVQQMKYLDMVVSETLRKWPAAIFTDRLASKSCNLGKGNRTSTRDHIIQKGEGLYIPIRAIHHDPKYYENPEKFDPERFSVENKHKIQPFTFIPFGAGPRNCIGSRFALCEVKVMVYQLLQHIEVTPSERTQIPYKLSKKSLTLSLEGGHWLKIKVRKLLN